MVLPANVLSSENIYSDIVLMVNPQQRNTVVLVANVS